MDLNLYVTFLIVSFGLVIVPGPNVLVIVSTSIVHGKKRGLQTVAGTSLAMAVQLIMASFSTAWIVNLFSSGLILLKWCGVAYLFYLGLYHLKKAMYPTKQPNAITVSATFARGFLVSLTNPKTLLFFSAFLPQFVTETGNYNFQIALLSLSFLGLAVVLDSCYALMSSKLVLLAKNRYLSSSQNGVSGFLFLGASAWLATINRST